MNADLGILADNITFMSLSNITFTTSKASDAVKRALQPAPASRGTYDGGFGMRIKGAVDTLINGFKFESKLVHDIVLGSQCGGVVLANGKGQDLGLQLQYDGASGPYGTLISNVDFGVGESRYMVYILLLSTNVLCRLLVSKLSSTVMFARCTSAVFHALFTKILWYL